MLKKDTVDHVNSNEFTAFVTKFLLGLGAVVFVGSCFNYQGLKYVRSIGTDCDNGLLILSLPDSHICCDMLIHSNDLVCAAASDSAEIFLKSNWALVLPLLPVLMTILTETFLLKKSIHISSIPALKRMVFYLGITLYRMTVLYWIPLMLTKMYYAANPHGVSCWCDAFVRNPLKKMEFDFSDHLVLCVVQYIIPSMLEMFYVLQRTSSSHNSINHSSTNTPNYELSKSVWYVMPLVACAAMIAVNLKVIVNVTLFFHTPLENLVAFLLVVVFGFVPLYFQRFVTLFLDLNAMNLK